MIGKPKNKTSVERSADKKENQSKDRKKRDVRAADQPMGG
jgi:hypothetical protein